MASREAIVPIPRQDKQLLVWRYLATSAMLDCLLMVRGIQGWASLTAWVPFASWGRARAGRAQLTAPGVQLLVLAVPRTFDQ